MVTAESPVRERKLRAVKAIFEQPGQQHKQLYSDGHEELRRLRLS